MKRPNLTPQSEQREGPAEKPAPLLCGLLAGLDFARAQAAVARLLRRPTAAVDLEALARRIRADARALAPRHTGRLK